MQLNDVPGLLPGPAQPGRRAVVQQLLSVLRTGQLQAGTRLPSARALARQWTVPRSAVDDAYAQLVSEGLIERRVGSGSFVRSLAEHGELLKAAPVTAARDPTPFTETLPLLRPLATDIDHFPMAAWKRHLRRAIGNQRDPLSYGPPAGLESLRVATARFLRLTRSIDCAPEQILIVNSAMHAIELIAQVLLEPGAQVAVEDPGFPGVLRVLRQAHLNVVPVPVDEQGFDVAAAARLAPNAAAYYLHPLNQYPTGWRTGAERRRALLERADAAGAWIIEGDHMAEISPRGEQPAALWRRDRAARVLYVGTFNGCMFPSLRLAFVLLPESLVPVFKAVRGMMGDHSPAAMQAALASFLDAGQLGMHLRQLRTLYDGRRRALCAGVAQQLGARAQLGPTGAGVHACLHLPAEVPDQAVAATLATRGVEVSALSALCAQPRGLNGLVLGYGGSDEAQIARALAIVNEVVDATRLAKPELSAW